MIRILRTAAAGIAVALTISLGTARAADAPGVTAQTTAGTVAGAATSLRTYRIGQRNVVVADPAMARLYALVEQP